MTKPSIIRNYNILQKRQWEPFEILRKQQEEQLRKMIDFAYNNVPYYNNLFTKLNLKPNEISTIKDLEKLPILTKKDIKYNWQDLIPKNINKIKFISGSTGGSTGQSLKYRMAKEDYEKSISIFYRALSRGGYNRGDKVAIIAGSSLIPNKKSELTTKSKNFFHNFRQYSSYQMSEENLYKYFNEINRWKPPFLRGYASSLYLFAKFVRDNNLKIDFITKAVFSTAEKLLDKQREIVEQVFNTIVFDTYSLNDGGVSAVECEKHCGMHIDTERSIMEVVDTENTQVSEYKGRILATSLYNYALPFIRYDTGDMGIISDSKCPCGRETLLLKEISGRTTDFLKLNNIIIGSPVLTVLMGKFDIENYQIIQESANSVTIKIVKGKDYNEKHDEEFIRKSFYTHVGQISINFLYVDSIVATEARKHKFIINEFV